MAQLCAQLNALSLGGSRSLPAVRSGCFRGTPVQQRCVVLPTASRQVGVTISAKYRGHGTDLSKVPQFKRHETDCGSEEVQIATLSARVEQLTAHLKEHRKDFATTRGLYKILGQRRRLMKFLQRKDPKKYDEVIKGLGVRPLRVTASQGRTMKVGQQDAKKRQQLKKKRR